MRPSAVSTSNVATSRRKALGVVVLAALAALPALFLAAGAGLGGAAFLTWLSTWATPAFYALGALVCIAGARAGGGYPDDLRGEAIPLGARIVAACDSYDAMVADRPYRSGIGHEAALAELREHSGTQFDPRVVEAFVETIEALRARASASHER